MSDPLSPGLAETTQPSGRGGARPGAGAPSRPHAATTERFKRLFSIASNADFEAAFGHLSNMDIVQICVWRLLEQCEWKEAGNLAKSLLPYHHARMPAVTVVRHEGAVAPEAAPEAARPLPAPAPPARARAPAGPPAPPAVEPTPASEPAVPAEASVPPAEPPRQPAASDAPEPDGPEPDAPAAEPPAPDAPAPVRPVADAPPRAESPAPEPPTGDAPLPNPPDRHPQACRRFPIDAAPPPHPRRAEPCPPRDIRSHHHPPPAGPT